MRLNGGEFLLEVEGDNATSAPSKGNLGLKSLEVTWYHIMNNTRDHSELSVIKDVLHVSPTAVSETYQSMPRKIRHRRRSWLQRVCRICLSDQRPSDAARKSLTDISR